MMCKDGARTCAADESACNVVQVVLARGFKSMEAQLSLVGTRAQSGRISNTQNAAEKTKRIT
jgi:hypothetical protein